MPFELHRVVPWGRSFEEYISMFSLTERDLNKKILGCSDGPASFNAHMRRNGHACISVDPMYQFSAKEIARRIDDSFEEVLEQTRKNKNEFIWDKIADVKELGRIRKSAMSHFLEDFELGIKEKRYIVGELPRLKFGQHEFDLALCSHFLFLYSQQFSMEFHIDSIKELCRVAREVRVFPVLELGSKTSRHLHKVMEILSGQDYQIEIKTVPYQFQKGGNKAFFLKRS